MFKYDSSLVGDIGKKCGWLSDETIDNEPQKIDRQ